MANFSLPCLFFSISLFLCVPIRHNLIKMRWAFPYGTASMIELDLIPAKRLLPCELVRCLNFKWMCMELCGIIQRRKWNSWRIEFKTDGQDIKLSIFSNPRNVWNILLLNIFKKHNFMYPRMGPKTESKSPPHSSNQVKNSKSYFRNLPIKNHTWFKSIICSET